MDTIITSELEKLPESVRGLLEEVRPLPAGVSFFEQRYTTGTFLNRIVIGLVLLVIAAGLILFSLEFLYEQRTDPKYREVFNVKTFVAGAVFAYAGWLMVSSVREGWTLKRRQAAGERTRHGVFLTSESLVCRSQFDTTVIPRENFRGLSGNNVDYLFKDAPKSFGLPTDWVGTSSAAVHQAITFWSQAAPPMTASVPPPLPGV